MYPRAHPKAMDEIEEALSLLSTTKSFDANEFADLISTSKNYALQILNALAQLGFVEMLPRQPNKGQRGGARKIMKVIKHRGAQKKLQDKVMWLGGQLRVLKGNKHARVIEWGNGKDTKTIKLPKPKYENIKNIVIDENATTASEQLDILLNGIRDCFANIIAENVTLRAKLINITKIVNGG